MKKAKKTAILLLCLCGVLLGACADKNPPGQDETAISLNGYLEEKGVREEYFGGSAVLQDINAWFKDGQIHTDFIIADDPSDEDIRYISYNLQRMFAYRKQEKGIRETLGPAGKTLLDFPADVSVRIQTDSGDPAWSFLGSYFYPGTRERNSDYDDYVWYATDWPADQNAYSFIYSEHPDTSKRVDSLETSMAVIGGVSAFSKHDILGLKGPWGFTMQSNLSALVEKWGTPEMAEAYYDDGVVDESILYFYYDFGRVRVLSSFTGIDDIYLDNASLAGPRGIRVGDSYQQVLKAYPAPVDINYQVVPRRSMLYRIPAPGQTADEAKLEAKILYRVPAPEAVSDVWGDRYDTTGTIYYDANGRVVKITYFAGFNQGKFNNRILGYELNYIIANDNVERIELRTVADWISTFW